MRLSIGNPRSFDPMTRRWLFRATLGAAVAGLLPVGMAVALTLDQARRQGLVGEQPDGYVGAVQQSAEVTALVTEINAARRQAYAELAAKHNVPLGTVAATAGQQLIEKLVPGAYYRNAAGAWIRK